MMKRLKKIVAAAVMCMAACRGAAAYNVVDLPQSMTFSEALGIYSASDIGSATICDIEDNIYKNLSSADISYFYKTASGMTVWRKINPTPFRGTCVNFTTKSGAQISYFYNAGIQIGSYGDSNFVCYMPSSDDTQKLRYLQSEFYDSDTGVYGGTYRTASTAKDFLKLPDTPWAKSAIKTAAAKNLVPYEFTNKYTNNITREQMAVLIANLIAVAGNYKDMDAYMNATGSVYLTGNFADCKGRDEAIDQLYALGIVNGISDTAFNPDGSITRQEAAALLVRAAGQYMYIDTKYKQKTADNSKIASWASFYVRWNMDNGILTADDSNMFYPTDKLTVQQAITATSRIYDLINYWED